MNLTDIRFGSAAGQLASFSQTSWYMLSVIPLQLLFFSLALGFMPDDSKGTKEIFRIENFEMVPLDEDKYGMFFGGDSYVIKYSYEKEGRPAYIVYFWQGQASSADEKAASAINAVKVDDDLSGKAVQGKHTALDF